MPSHIVRSRRIESALSLAAVGLLACALALVYSGKRAESARDPILVNSAASDRFAVELGVDEEIAERIIAERTLSGGFLSSDQLTALPIFSREEARRLETRLGASQIDARTAGPAQLSAALGISAPLADRLAAYRNTLTGAAGNAPARGAGGALPANWLRRAPLLDPDGIRPDLHRLQVRTPVNVFRQFTFVALALLVALFLFPAWLRSRSPGDPFLVPLSLLLAGLGVVILFSIKDPLRDQAVYIHHALGMILGMLALAGTVCMPAAARRRMKRYGYLWALAAVGLVILLFIAGHGPEDVRLSLFGIQPVEIIKLLLVLFLASYLADRADLIADITPSQSAHEPGRKARILATLSLPRKRDIGPVCIMFALAMALFFVVKDLGPVVLLFGTVMTVLYLATGRSSFIWLGAALLLIGGSLGYYLHIGVYPTRVDMWQHPFSNTHPTGMQLGQSYWAMASGGVEGMGLGLGDPGLIPRAGSDLAFASWVEETGLLGAWLVLTIFAVLVWRGVRIALHTANGFDRSLAFGLTTLFAVQTAFILGGVTGVFPLSGIALPFLSYGNSALLANFLLIGLLRGISASAHDGAAHVSARPEIATASRRFALAVGAFLLGVIGLLRVGSIEAVHADEIAARPIVTPDADRIARPHVNPRLLDVANAIERGSIYDRNGHVVATSRQDEILHVVRDGRAARRLIDAHSRLYPFGAALAHLVGYLDPASGGPSGIEKGFNSELRGFQRYEDLLPDYRNRAMPLHRPRRSRSLILALDAPLQSRIAGILQRTCAGLKDMRTGEPHNRAAFVLIQPATGDVLAAASIPAFDPGALTPAEYQSYLFGPRSKDHVLINRAIQGLYPPGSTLKVATAAAALECLPGAMRFKAVCNQVSGPIRWRTHKNNLLFVRTGIHDDSGDPPFGVLTMAPAFRVSSNIYFASLAAAIGPTAFRTALTDRMSFRHVPGPAAFDTDLPDIGYGQGRMLATPIEMARLAGAVANDGRMMESRFVLRTENPDNPQDTRQLPSKPLSQAMAASTAAEVRKMMRSVVESGTAQGLFGDLPVGVAGKTGTAQNRQNDRQPHSWFIGFAPFSETDPSVPAYAFACCVENGGYGRRVAGLVCNRVLHCLY